MWFGQIYNVKLKKAFLWKFYWKIKPLRGSFGIDIILQYQIILIIIFYTLKMTNNNTLSAINKLDD